MQNFRKKVSGGYFFSPGKSPSMPDGIRYGWWLALTFLPPKVAEKTWVNHLTHTLTHNSLDSSGQGSTKQQPVAPKTKKSKKSKRIIQTTLIKTTPSNRFAMAHRKGFNLFTCLVSCQFPAV